MRGTAASAETNATRAHPYPPQPLRCATVATGSARPCASIGGAGPSPAARGPLDAGFRRLLASPGLDRADHRMFPALRLRVLLAAALFAVGCAGAPVQTMSDTRQAIRAAEAAGAATTAPTQLNAAREQLKRAEDLIRSGEYRAARREAEAARA